MKVVHGGIGKHGMLRIAHLIRPVKKRLVEFSPVFAAVKQQVSRWPQQAGRTPDHRNLSSQLVQTEISSGHFVKGNAGCFEDRSGNAVNAVLRYGDLPVCLPWPDPFVAVEVLTHKAHLGACIRQPPD